ncbi:MAG: DUF2156 domain-containing protein [Desulfatibacillaceae bacterium]
MDFTPVIPKDYYRWAPFFQNQKYALSAYSLDAISVWANEFYHPEAAVDGDALVVCAQYTRSPEKNHMILPVTSNGEYTPDMLRDLVDRAGMDTFWFVPADYVERYRDKGLEGLFELEEQEDYADYVYRTDDLADLPGNRYHKKRNLISQFTKKYAAKGRVEVERVSPDNAADCLDFLERWCRERECDQIPEEDDDLLCEKKACENAFENLDRLSAGGLCVRVDGRVEAFGLGSRLTGDMAALHFEKASTAFKGLYQFVDRECASQLFDGFTYTNKESDMGIPGLEKAKKSYHPVRLVESYRLVAK